MYKLPCIIVLNEINKIVINDNLIILITFINTYKKKGHVFIQY